MTHVSGAAVASSIARTPHSLTVHIQIRRVPMQTSTQMQYNCQYTGLHCNDIGAQRADTVQGTTKERTTIGHILHVVKSLKNRQFRFNCENSEIAAAGSYVSAKQMRTLHYMIAAEIRHM